MNEHWREEQERLDEFYAEEKKRRESGDGDNSIPFWSGFALAMIFLIPFIMRTC